MQPQKVGFERQRKMYQVRGVMIPVNDIYLAYAEGARDAAQQRVWTFCKAVKPEFVMKG